jgi:uncharacterized protein (DUF305 family)
MRKSFSLIVAILLAITSLAWSDSATCQAAPVRRGYTAADVQFMQGMIAHHAQALAMTALVPPRTGRQVMRLLAQRIEVSQNDEIGLMQRWLQRRHEAVPALDAKHVATMQTNAMPGMSMGSAPTSSMMMPGMLTPEQLAQLANTSGAEFEKLFLQDMIRHHEGALVMVHDLLGTNGAAQEPEVFQFASDIDADQRAEILRMRALLGGTPSATR